MADDICLPRLGATVTHGTLTEWLVGDGDTVAVGDDLYTVATDKVEITVPAAAAGVVRIEAEVEKDYAVGDRLGVIEPARSAP